MKSNKSKILNIFYFIIAILIILSGLNFIISVFLLLVYDNVFYFIYSTLVSNILIILMLVLI